MKLSRIASVLVVALLLSPALFAAEDLTGKWTGTFVTSMNGEAPNNDTALMVFKHTGKELTGTAGPNVGQQWTIQKGTVTVTGAAGKEQTKVAFDVPMGEGAGPTLHVELELVGGRLKGNAKAEMDGMKLTAVIDLQREK
jgi:hypothetical protein